MNSFELNKVRGAILATCLFVLSVNLIADSLFAPVKPAKPGFQIAVQEQSTSSAPAGKVETAAPIEVRLASADLEHGKSESKVCMACHTLEKGGPNRVGPNLWGIVDRPRASHSGFDYSGAMRAKGGNWTFDELDKFIAHPQGYIPGTKMSFSGIENPSQRANLIAYLRTLSDDPVSLPSAPASSASGNQKSRPATNSTPNGKAGG